MFRKNCTGQGTSLFYLGVKPFRLQKTGLKTTATFLEDKDVQNMAGKRKNLLRECRIKTNIWNELPNLTIRKLKKLTQTYYRKNVQKPNHELYLGENNLKGRKKLLPKFSATEDLNKNMK